MTNFIGSLYSLRVTRHSLNLVNHERVSLICADAGPLYVAQDRVFEFV
jgi:hypothetical protein